MRPGSKQFAKLGFTSKLGRSDEKVQQAVAGIWLRNGLIFKRSIGSNQMEVVAGGIQEADHLLLPCEMRRILGPEQLKQDERAEFLEHMPSPLNDLEFAAFHVDLQNIYSSEVGFIRIIV